MKNLTKLSLALSASALLAMGSVFADDTTDDDQDAEEIKIIGHVPLVCNMTADNSELDLGHNPETEVAYILDGLTFTCNSKTGAKIQMDSANDSLIVNGSKEHFIDYEAWLKTEGFENFQDDTSAELTTQDGQVVIDESALLNKDPMLAMGLVTGYIQVNLLDDAKFAGYYEDHLTVTIEAR